jgi:aldose 1-epimerase
MLRSVLHCVTCDVQHGAVALETQAFPNAINVPAWQQQVILREGQRYHHKSKHLFRVAR